MIENFLTYSANQFSDNYREFDVNNRILLTGHSHQAWPDAAKEGMMDYWKDTSAYVDDKWGFSFEKANQVRKGFAEILKDKTGSYALGANTHELVIRLISALDLKNKPVIITTDGEFHTLRRQLARLGEIGIEICIVPSENPNEIVGDIIRKLDDRTALVAISKVMFKTSDIVPDMALLAQKCDEKGVTLLIDAYHALDAIPFTIEGEGIDSAFIVGGGYKYCQLGEGNCFLRIPPGCSMKPVITGWFSEFSLVSNTGTSGEVRYGINEARFAGSTYDATSHYRADRVFKFFRENELTPEFLREISLNQIKYLAEKFDETDIPEKLIKRDRTRPLESKGAFMTLVTPIAEKITGKLRERKIFVDFRGDNLRLGPAPYLSLSQLENAIFEIKEIILSL